MPAHSWMTGSRRATADSELVVQASPEATRRSPKCQGWIESPAYDVAIFSLSPIAGLLLILVDHFSRWGHAAGDLAVYFVGIPHYLSTFTFYFADQNRDQYRLRWMAFFLGPVIIFAIVFSLRSLAVQGVVQSAIFVWNVYHVSFQSSGILSLYRRLNGGLQAEKRWAQLTILFVNSTMASWNLRNFSPLYGLLLRIHPWTPVVLRYAFLATALVVGACFTVQLLRRQQPLRRPEWVFLISSLLLFHPYLWVKDYLLATIAMLMGHFIQYLGIIWLLNRRKYAQQSSGSAAQQWLIRLSTRPRLLMAILMLVGAFFLSIDRGSRMFGMYFGYIIVWNSLVLIHFYIDGLVWAFKDPFVRKTVGPFLVLDSHLV
jgi:hypothetical protein